MQTIGLSEAAKLLRCNEETVRKKTIAGEIPGVKIGRSWVYVKVDLLAWMRSQYARDKKLSQPSNSATCHSTKTAGVHTGISASSSTVVDCDEALGLLTKPSPSASTTKLRLVCGKKQPSQSVTHGRTHS
ncbi:MAG: helix-turn-helix domain-containing protein [Ferrovum myxofaciens]|uniref:Helix-turn-helix domain-containing protein n=1 Tax=Ferrovum myxofaciens TaxID=416213 RepID=A0A9E6MZ17_9PROT|nr:MAG: helix-turn-helix domain-containing protein [Ferrovum myxofaciens]QWY74949.1 MAG: helix-turn-helix domain-containing protein [Ferrovum myxofaciens]QWY77697.1 MAG: helix-turn-helix domain-containing protein [Ferrovum myxofaciens]